MNRQSQICVEVIGSYSVLKLIIQPYILNRNRRLWFFDALLV